MRTLLCLLLAATLLAAADVDLTGKWTGTFDMNGPNGETNNSTALLVLKQSGTAITGTVGPNEEQQFPLVKGKVEGDKITLEADREGNPVTFNLVLADGRLKGEVLISRDGETRKAKIDVGRAK